MNDGSWLAGIGLTLAGHALNGIVAFLAGNIGGGWGESLALALVFGVGLAQALWVVPLAVWAGLTGRKRTLWGTLVTAGTVFLLNGACWGTLAAGGAFY